MGLANLSIDRELIPMKINEFLAISGYDIELAKIEQKGDPTQYRYYFTDGNYFDAYYKKDGKTTLRPNIGDQKFQERNVAVCEYLEKTCCVTIKYTTHVGKADAKTYEQIVSGIKSNNYYKNHEQIDVEHGLKITFTGKQGDKAHLTRYYTDTLQLQGKPMIMFNIILNEIIMIAGLDILDAKGDLKHIAEGKLAKLLPNIDETTIFRPFMDNLMQAVVFYNYPEEVYDYTFLICPAIRAIEWQIRKMFDNNCIELKNGTDRSFFQFEPNDMGNYILKQEYARKCLSQEVRLIEKLYGLYKKYRNPYYHSGDYIKGLDTTKIVESRVEADQIIEEILSEINNCYV